MTKGFLTSGNEARLARAALVAHRTWELRLAQVDGCRVERDRGAVWTLSERPGAGHCIAMPEFSGPDGGARLDRIMGQYRASKPRRMIGTWSPERAVNCNLQAMLVARGFHWGGRGTAMACDLRRLPAKPHAGLRISRSFDGDLWTVRQHPYHLDTKDAAVLEGIRLRHSAQDRWPERVAHFVAWLDDVLVGHATVSLKCGPLGTAGIYDVGVLPKYRNRGIGYFVTHAACAQGKRWGARFAVLGASDMGYSVYRRLNFQDIGPSWYWPCSEIALAARPVSPRRVRVIEAIIRGEKEIVEKTWRREDASWRLPSGLLMIDVAGKAQEIEILRWLLNSGARPSILGLWEGGMRKEAAELMRREPSLLNARTESWGSTALHQAILRNDETLVRVMLDAGADVTVTDNTFGGDAKGWANHFGRTHIFRLIETYRPSS